MALILEVRHQDGRVLQRLPIACPTEGAPERATISIGRALGNQVVLDDPYVDAQHAQIVCTQTGELLLQDLGSLNKLATETDGKHDQVLLAHNTIVTIGYTTLRFRDEHAGVEPTLPLPERPKPVAAAHPQSGNWYGRLPGQLGIVALMLTLAGAEVWLNATDRSAASQALYAVLGAGAGASLWAGMWSVLARIVTGRFHFMALLTLSAAAAAIASCLEALSSWGEFLLPDNESVRPLFIGLQLALLSAFVATLLSYASHMKRSWCILGGIMGSVAVLATYGTFALLEDDEFTAVATFAGQIMPVNTALIPTDNAKVLHSMAVDLKADVDEMLSDEGG